MKHLHLVLALMLFIPTLQAKTKSWPEVYKSARPSIPVIRHGGGVCSGALVSANTVLTAHHCVDTLRPITVQWFDGDVLKLSISAKVQKWLPKSDLALLELSQPVTYTPLKVAPKVSLEIGSEHATIGHPFGIRLDFEQNLRQDLLFAFTKGMINKVNEDKNFITDMSLSPGNSGGPVLNAEGEIIGTVSAKVVRRGAGSIGLVIHPQKIEELQKQTPQNLTWVNASSNVDLLLKETYFNLDIKGRSKPLRDQVSAAELKVLYKDRIVLSAERSFSSSKEDIEYRGYTLGYNFYYQTSGFIPLTGGPLYKYTKFHHHDNHNFVGFYLKAIGFHLEAGINPENEKEYYSSIGLLF